MLQRTSELSDFWKPVSEFEGQESSQQYSRYLSDFDELQPLGEQIAHLSGLFYCSLKINQYCLCCIFIRTSFMAENIKTHSKCINVMVIYPNFFFEKEGFVNP